MDQKILKSIETGGLCDKSGLGPAEKFIQGLDKLGRIQMDADYKTEYYSEGEIRTREILAKRADSAPVYSSKNKSSTTKILKSVKPKLKEKFCSGKIIKWNDFCGKV